MIIGTAVSAFFLGTLIGFVACAHGRNPRIHNVGRSSGGTGMTWEIFIAFSLGMIAGAICFVFGS